MYDAVQRAALCMVTLDEDCRRLGDDVFEEFD
jgi:hypothetical protein